MESMEESQDESRLGREPSHVADATDFPPFGPSAVVAPSPRLPSTTTGVPWGAELPHESTLARALEGDGREVELREGIAPLLDGVRSRRRSVSPA